MDRSVPIQSFMRDLMEGKLSTDQIIPILESLAPDSLDEHNLADAAREARAHGVCLALDYPVILDTCGTGGDGKHGINVSTLTALLCAAAGIRVAKHGNRAISSRSGSADILEKLGVRIDL